MSVAPGRPQMPMPAEDGGPGWVAELLGLRVEIARDAAGGGLDGLAGLAVRRNPRRAHLLVSRLLAKHLPVDPHRALAAGTALAAELPREVASAGPLVFGFAETATGLGHAVAAALPGSTYVSSTRRPGAAVLSFDEEHSHAVGHRVLAGHLLADPSRPVVLVDDEFSTGRTAANTIRALHDLAPRPGYALAALTDLRPEPERRRLDALAAELAVPVRAASLLSGAVHVAADAVGRAAPLIEAGDPPLALRVRHHVSCVDPEWPARLPLGGRYGWGPELEQPLADALEPLAQQLADRLSPHFRRPGEPGRVLVLGTEELMYVPIRLAAALADVLGPAALVRAQSTTRSPVVPIDRSGYAVRRALAFAAPDDPSRPSYVYNVGPGHYDAIVVVGDPPTRTAPGALLAAVAGCAPVVFLRLPERPR